MSVRISVLLLICTVSIPVFLPSCRSSRNAGNDQENPEPRFPAYRVQETFQTPELTDRDRKLAKNIRRHQQGRVTPLEEIKRQSKILRYIQSLSSNEITRRVSGTGTTIAAGLNDRELPADYYGRWFRIRGRPVSTPEDNPFRGHLDVNATIQQFTVENPADYEAPAQKMYYVIVSLEELPPQRPTEVILEMDGLLWTTWDLPSIGPTKTGNTPQTGIPVLFVKEYRIVKK